MTKKKNANRSNVDEQRESGAPGGGQGRRDEVGGSGVYSRSSDNIPGDAVIRTPWQWGQGERGADGYEDSGGSDLIWRNGQLLGGLTSDASGRPTIDTHGGDRPDAHQASQAQRGSTKRSAGKRSSKSGKKPGGGKSGRGTYGPGAGGERMVEQHHGRRRSPP